MKKIFFLVNNEYHRTDMGKHIETINGYEVNEICIPHAIKKETKLDGIQHAWCFESPFCSRDWWNPFVVNRVHQNIELSICVHSDDVLILYTEFDPLNLFVAAHFKNKGAKVFILEEGIASYLIGHGAKHREQLSIKEKLKMLVFKYIYRYGFLQVEKLGGVLYYRLQNEMVTGVLLYRNYKLLRAVKSYHVKKPAVKSIQNPDLRKWVFFSAPIYKRYINKDTYVSLVCEAIKNTPKGILVYLRFHPRDTEEIRERIIHELPSCPVVEDELSIRDMIYKYKFSVALSHMSNALFEVDDFGVTPVFLYNTVPCLSSRSNIQTIGKIAKSLGNFIILNDIACLSSIERHTCDQYRMYGKNIKSLVDVVESSER